MDELEISGKRYISTRRAAKDHKYHSDYIGQLIRAGKVEGQKVGRSWYVAADSLSEYLGKEGSTKPPVVRAQTPVVRPVRQEPEKIVEPVEEKKNIAVKKIEHEIEPEEIKDDEEEHRIPVTISRPVEIKKEVPTVRATRGALRYVADDGPLYPRAERPRAQVMPRSVEEVSVEIFAPEIELEEEPVVVLEKPRRKKNNSKAKLMRMGAVLALGALTLGVIAGASAFIVSTTTVQGESANVNYSFGGMP